MPSPAELDNILRSDNLTVGGTLTCTGTVDMSAATVNLPSGLAETITSLNVPILGMTGTTGNQEIRLTTNLADALSIEDTVGDLIVFNTTTGSQRITFTPAVTFSASPTFPTGGIIVGTTTISEAEIGVLDGVTAGTTSPSKALVLDAAESLVWATTDATASETVTLSVADTRTGAGATGWAIKGDLISNVALGSYANGVYGILSLGAAGKVTGLGAGVVSEIVLGAGCTDGTYAGLEVEVGMPANAVTGTSTSFMYLSLYGAAAGTFDTNGFLFELAGVTKASGKVLQDVSTGATARPVQVLKVKTPDGVRYLPLYDTAACGA